MEKNSDASSESSNNPKKKLGLVCQYRFLDGSSQFHFLHFDNDLRAISSNQLTFSTENYHQTIASCNGLLLLISFRENQLVYHVFNPLTKEIITSLPQPCIPGRVIISSGLAFDGHHYQVVFVHIPNFEYSAATLELEIFSSKTNNWRRHTPDNLCLPSHPPKDVFSELATAPIFSNGAIHWEICGRLLVYNVQADYCTLINLPTEWCFQSASTYKRCFWESDGRVHYSYTDSQGVHTWVLLNEFDLAYYSKLYTIDCKEFPWKLADSLHYQTLKENNPEIFKQGNKWETHYLSPFAYNEASQTMYMQLPGIVVSYNTKTRVLQRVCTFKFLGKDFNCCSFLPFVYSGQGQPSEAEIVVELPVREVASSLSF